jgi:hypothetical protein
MAGRFRNVESPVGRNGNVLRSAEHGVCGQTSIPPESGHSCAGDGADDRRRIDSADPIPAGDEKSRRIGDEQVSGRGTCPPADVRPAAALQAQQVAQEAVTATLALVAKAPTGKDRAAVESIKADAEALKASLNQVQEAIDAADYSAAQTKAKAIHEKSQAVSGEIEAALSKIGKGKPSAAKKK